jgi:DNA-binding response OmpR family regulator
LTEIWAAQGEGYSVTLAYDGEEALRLGKTGNYDVMLLDIMLLRVNGLTVIKKLHEDRLRTQAIIVSARDTMHDIVYGLDADDYLTEPIALDVLLAKVRAVTAVWAYQPPICRASSPSSESVYDLAIMRSLTAENA